MMKINFPLFGDVFESLLGFCMVLVRSTVSEGSVCSVQ